MVMWGGWVSQKILMTAQRPKSLVLMTAQRQKSLLFDLAWDWTLDWDLASGLSIYDYESELEKNLWTDP